ncbi:MAG: DUF2236 domain-containing protein [Chitinophagaceae bacterium]|nr:MAG: DUF2236 domain-containing protein [Chitinophagaceae bacterium]
MERKFFVEPGSIVREIWGRADIVLFIFAGAAAEFAVNKAVDWLYFTGKLPADPIGRMFSTMNYAKQIVFAPLDKANHTIDAIRKIHLAVEQARGSSIPEEAYRDVLFMLIRYSISAFEVLERKLSNREKAEVYQVFLELGNRMGLKKNPSTYMEWQYINETYLVAGTGRSPFSADLYRQYRKHLGPLGFFFLVEVQRLITPKHVKTLLGINKTSLLALVLPVYRVGRRLHLDKVWMRLLLPCRYSQQVKGLEKCPFSKAVLKLRIE